MRMAKARAEVPADVTFRLSWRDVLALYQWLEQTNASKATIYERFPLLHPGPAGT